MNELLLDTLVDKVNVQEMKMSSQHEEVKDIKEKLTLLQENVAVITEVNRNIQELHTTLKSISFPEKAIKELSDNLLASINLLKQPVKQDIVHHHHVPKITWITAVLLVTISIIVAGWYNTGTKLDQYRANDIAWRFFKLRTSPESLNSFHEIETLYQKDPEKMREEVEKEEARNRQIEEAKRKAAEAEETIKNLNKSQEITEPIKKRKNKE